MMKKNEKSASYSFSKRIINAFKRDGLRVITRRLKRLFGLNALGYSALFEHKLDYVDTDSFYQENEDFSDFSTDIKMLAFYLPQFHTFKENDEWWGKGFTEWTNTKAAQPRFSGHYQPRTPHSDIGYYDLTDIEVIKRQVELAKQHKIYGFCFYYYWFSGKRLMEKPVDLLLEHKEIDFPFCLCWANENFTRTWDGKNKNVLIAQDYSEKDDEQFMVDLKKYIDDYRYIRINGKPVVIVYNPGQILSCKRTFNKWREVAKNIGIGDICIFTCRTFNNTAKKLGIEPFIDAEIEFPPHNLGHIDFAIGGKTESSQKAHIYNYQKVVDGYIYDRQNGRIAKSDTPLHPTCMLGFDNSARRKQNWTAYHNFSLSSLYNWVHTICDQARRDFDEQERFVFINAWNEWAEGTYLEPDAKYGYANINTVAKALTNQPMEDNLTVINNDSKVADLTGKNIKIAVQIHMFYTETLDETIQNINKIPYDFDCYVSTDTDQKAKIIKERLDKNCRCKTAIVEVYENRGRDVAPFILQMQNRIDKYDYVCHIHSKRTVTASHGNDWREYIFKHLFGSEEYLKRLFTLFESEQSIGIMFPETFPPLENQTEWGGNLAGCMALLSKLGAKFSPPQTPLFPVGNMFWAKTEAIRQMFSGVIDAEDFPEESGQVNATIAHCIERSWVYLAADYGFDCRKIFNNVTQTVEIEDKKRIAFYAHYNKDNVISDTDLDSLKIYKNIFDKIVFVSNSPLNDEQTAIVKTFCDTVIFRENTGFDFAAWKLGVEQFGWENTKEYDSLALINNSTLPPIFSLDNMFFKMEQEKADFWGITLFPEIKGKKYLKANKITEHLQSYFVVFGKNVINSSALKEFFDNLKTSHEFTDAVLNGEVELTKFMAKKGYTYSPFIKESYYMWHYLGNFKIPYDKPATLALLGCPFVKKKAYSFMSGAERIKLESFINKLK
ncbi:MAG: glycoside hydrolase family 99-like domain-containing protein [Clostridia bacterium]|nr:glycoside hydrolase family 99-like domain-containing protein [Clostridia bacterium]